MNPTLQKIQDRAADVRSQINHNVQNYCTCYNDGLRMLAKISMVQVSLLQDLQDEDIETSFAASLCLYGLHLYSGELLTALNNKFPCKQSGEPSSAGPSSAAPASTSTGAPPTSPAPKESAPTSGPA